MRGNTKNAMPEYHLSRQIEEMPIEMLIVVVEEAALWGCNSGHIITYERLT